MRRISALAVWCFAVWVLLTWTLTAEQLGVGAVVAIVVAVLLAPVGDVVEPWRLLAPRRLVATLRLFAVASRRIVVANVRLSIRIWRPSRPLTSGMVIVSTQERSDAGVGGVGLITSLIVDNQVLDVDRSRHELLFHAVAVPSGGDRAAYDEINGPVERLLQPVEGRHG